MIWMTAPTSTRRPTNPPMKFKLALSYMFSATFEALSFPSSFSFSLFALRVIFQRPPMLALPCTIEWEWRTPDIASSGGGHH